MMNSPIVLPVVDLDLWLEHGDAVGCEEQARRTVEALAQYGALVVKDRRVTEADNDAFLVCSSHV